MRLFGIHIVLKDLSFMFFYFLIMKYNWTNETYLPKTIENFPGAPSMTIVDMICSSLFFNFLTLVVSFLTYYPIVAIGKKIFKKNNIVSRVIIGFVLTCTTPVFYFALSNWKHNDYYMQKAELIAWILCFFVSITCYVLLNIDQIKNDETEK